MKSRLLFLVIVLPFFALVQAASLSPADYIKTTYESAIFSKTEITAGEAFSVTIKSRGVATKDLPFPSKAARFSYRYVAVNKTSGEKLVLNSFYGAPKIEPFPQKTGETYETSNLIPLKFPTGSKAGSYMVIEEPTGAEMKAPELGWQNAFDSSRPPEPRSIGMVKYSTGQSIPVSPPVSTSTPEPTSTSALPLPLPLPTSTPEPTQISFPKPAPSSVLAVSSLTVTPDSVEGGTSLVGTVTLNKPASDIDFGGTIVWLSTTPNASLSFPQNMKVKAGATSGTFNIRTNKVKSSVKVTVTARLNNVAKTAVVTINPPPPPPPPLAVSALTLLPASVVIGEFSVGTVTLSGVAPAGGLTVRLYANYPTTVLLPTSVMVAGAARSGTFKFQSKWVSAPMDVTVTAQLLQSSNTALSQKTAVLKINPSMTVSALTLSPSSVISGNSSVGTVTLSKPAPTGGQAVPLSATPSSSLTLPASISVKAGASSGTFNIRTNTVASPINANIVATLNNSQKTTRLTINPTPSSCSYACRPATQSGSSWVTKCNSNEVAQSWSSCPKTNQSYRCGFWGTRRCYTQVDSICCKAK
ncbi:MAG: hypothetical protein V1856_01435 [Candidatus Liptonbacteria bacterium]